MALDFPNNPVNGDTWTDTNGVEWVFYGYGWKQKEIPLLNLMTDVSITSPNIGDRLTWDGTNWIDQPKSLAFADLTDVIGTPVQDDYIVSDGTNFITASSNSDPLVFAKVVTDDNSDIPELWNDNVWWWVEYKTEAYDTDNMVDLVSDNTKVTIQQSGIYKICAYCSIRIIYSVESSIEIMHRTYVYDSSDNQRFRFDDNLGDCRYYSSGYVNVGLNRILKLNAGDYVKQYIRFNNIASVFSSIQAQNLYISVLKISDLI